MGRFKTGVVLGFAAGYVRGSKAGRERYEQINRAWRRVKGTRAYQEASSKVSAAVGLGLARGRVVAMDGLRKATGMASTRRKEDDWSGELP